jgi:chemotaxis protein methyltransferase CheR
MSMTAKNEMPASVSEHEMREICALIESRSGIHFDESRTRFLNQRVNAFLEEKKLSHGLELLRMIRGTNSEYDRFLERLLTQETSFMRYPAIYKALAKKVLPDLHTKKFWENPRSLRIWSAGCSTGEEPYSIGITVADTFSLSEAWNIHILATDISRQALDIAERGIFHRRELIGLTQEQLDAYFTVHPDGYKVKPKIRQMVTFAPMNLAQAVYMGKFDCIFCMNVLIYFSEERRAALIQRFHDYLEPGGYLFLGHAESVAKTGARFEPIVVGDSLIYQKPWTGPGSSLVDKERA